MARAVGELGGGGVEVWIEDFLILKFKKEHRLSVCLKRNCNC